ncbi:hypothetical protein [Roseicyclus amphidinii]|uniref:hypothetical protein n=1 Tax=Roseicyclus amphidinii TaxID=3034232 RepID=UPI0024E12018|nr:hypothetical protein [Roseicyclus sp. Amp-Y-6]
MIWSPASILAARFGLRRRAAEFAARWRRAFLKDPALKHDLIRLGGILELPTVDLIDRVPVVEDKTPYQLGVEAGRRALALELLALGQIDPTELEETMEQEQ